MKKILLLIFASGLIAGGMSSCGRTGGATSTDTAADGTETSVARSDLKGEIVFVRMDSLMRNFVMYKELNSAFEERSSKAEAELTSRGRSLERDMMNAQEKVQKGLVTRIQAQSLEEELGRKQQNFVNYRDKLMGELAEEEQVIMNRISNSINQFMQEFNKGNRFRMVISTTPAGPILVADPAFDVTAEAIEGLNAYYAANKEKL